MTPEFLSSISSPNSLLGKLMASDPNFGEAMELFSKSPTQALEKYRDRPEYVTALKEFSARIAERFEALADIEDEKKKRHMFQVSSSKVSTAGLPVHEQELVHKVMSDPNIQVQIKL